MIVVYIFENNIIMLNTNHFDSYCNHICNNKEFNEMLITEEDYLDSIKDYCNNFSSFLVIKKKPIDDIKNYRKEIIIDYYILTYKYDNKEELKKYYEKNIKDDYNMKYNPPPSYMIYDNDEEVEKQDDISDHYDNINKKYEYYGNKSLIDKNNIDEDLDYDFNDDGTISMVSSQDNIYDENYDDYEDFDDYEEYEEYFSDDYDY